MPRQDSTADVMADRIGQKLAQLIRDDTSRTEIRSVAFGSAEFLAQTENIDRLLPGIWIRPTASSDYVEAEQTASLFAVSDTFRIAAVAPYRQDQDPIEAVSKILRIAVRVLRGNRALTGLDIAPHRLVDSGIVSIDWDPFENEFFRELGSPIRVATLLWSVRWLTR